MVESRIDSFVFITNLIEESRRKKNMEENEENEFEILAKETTAQNERMRESNANKIQTIEDEIKITGTLSKKGARCFRHEWITVGNSLFYDDINPTSYINPEVTITQKCRKCSQPRTIIGRITEINYF